MKTRARALHEHLYRRPVPVNDAAMLARSVVARVLSVLVILAAVASFAGNIALFYLFGFGYLATVLLAVGTTALPLVVGHLAYEKLVARDKRLQAIVVVAAVGLCFVGLLRLNQARQTAIDKATTPQVAGSYVDGATTEPQRDDPAPSTGPSETQSRQTLGGALFLILVAADLMLGFLSGLLSRLRTDEDYRAWIELKNITEHLAALEENLAGLAASVEIAKAHCMAGILRAENVLNSRRAPYHQLAILMLLGVLATSPLRAQTIAQDEGILIDTSGSIGRNRPTSDLFREYLVSTKQLLAAEPPESRVWVLAISTDSFGSVRAIVKGWTPAAHGVFTDDLTRARRELAATFERRSSGMAPIAAGTDVIGAVWHLKAFFEADHASRRTKTIRIFSDMVNETRDFNMPALISSGPERMLERAKANGLMVPLDGYRIYVQGASPSGLTPQAWTVVKAFWEKYFKAAGAELVTYSAECSAERE